LDRAALVHVVVGTPVAVTLKPEEPEVVDE
jgi:hypothetical protein